MNSQLTLNIGLRDDATFENFIGSAGARIQGRDRLHYIWVPAGSGKSHLLQALCHNVNSENGDSIYLENLKSNSAEILHSLESFTLICLDDIDDILGDEKWELAMFHLMNSVKDGTARLIISASVPAAKLKCNLPDLASRLRAAVAVETGTPGDEEKIIMLKKRANNRGFELNDEVARFILGRAPRNMGHLIELLGRLEVETLRQQKMVTIPFVKKTLQL